MSSVTPASCSSTWSALRLARKLDLAQPHTSRPSSVRSVRSASVNLSPVRVALISRTRESELRLRCLNFEMIGLDTHICNSLNLFAPLIGLKRVPLFSLCAWPSPVRRLMAISTN